MGEGGGVSVVAQQPIEMILLHQWASYMAIPIGVLDVEGNLVYYNEPAEAIVGQRFDDYGEINASEFADLGQVTDGDGERLSKDDIPSVIALTKQRLAYRHLRYTDGDGQVHDMEVASFPVMGQGGRMLGAVTIWDPVSP